MKIATAGIDLAKKVFQVHAVDERGRAVLRKQLRRDQMTAFFANPPPCVIGMEACARAHHWARTLQKFGHTVRLMAPQFVKSYAKTNKNDVADAEAISEAVGRPNMRFVPIKSVEQQAVPSLHRVRQGFVRARTAMQRPRSRSHSRESEHSCRSAFTPLASSAAVDSIRMPAPSTQFTPPKSSPMPVAWPIGGPG